MKSILRNIVYKTTYKYVDESKLEIKRIKMSDGDLSYFNLSSNPIISFTHNGNLCYFRECTELSGFNEYLAKSVEAFFRTIRRLHIHEEHFKQEIPIKLDFSDEIISFFKEYLTAKLADKSVKKTVARADAISQQMHFSIWEEQSYTDGFFAAFGFADLPDELRDITIYFIWYIRNALMGYRIMKIAHGKRHSCFSAVRAVSSKIVADFIGLGDVITSAEFCEIELNDGKSIFGVLSESARGMRMADSEAELNGSLQRALTNLNLLDVICYQPDHGPNNYNVFRNENGDYTVCAFDNDNPKTFFPSPMSDGSFAGCAPFIDQNGFVNRPYLDRAVADAVISLDSSALKNQLKPYLNRLQMCALLRRLKKLQSAIKKTASRNEGFLLDANEWNRKTAERETNGNYGTTYLSKALKTK